jgi:hypothetical protein
VGVAIPELTRRSAEAEVRAFCERRVPAHARDQIRLDHTVRGEAITIVERRLPRHEDLRPEWSSMTIAQLRFEGPTATWTLWWSDRNGRWHRYDDVGPTPDLDPLLREIDEDPTGIFWG